MNPVPSEPCVAARTKSNLLASRPDIAVQAEQAEPIMLCRHELSLYAHISSLTWQTHDAKRWLGNVSDTAAGDIRTVDLSEDDNSHFDMINKVWDVIDPSSQLPDLQ